jgi:PAS domain S-box-containing protein
MGLVEYDSFFLGYFNSASMPRTLIERMLSMALIPESWKIVLIDDEADIREVVSLALMDAGYQVAAAPDGEAGVRLCEEEKPQIVITDIRMPRMDGIQVLETVKERYPDVEVIVVTAFGEMDLAVRALQLDASDFITKPIGDEALFLALGRAEERYTARKRLKDYTLLLEKGWARTAQELIRTFTFQENLIESSMDGILACDEKERVVTFNKSMEQMLGYRKEEVLQKMDLSVFFLPEDALRLSEALESENYGGPHRLYLYETNLLGIGGRKIPVQMSASVLFNEGHPAGKVCFFRDLREIRRLEREMADQAQILHQDKMMSMGRLAASVVHEINNPLAGILNYIRLMMRILRRGVLSEEQREKFQRYLDLVETETDRCSRIVSGLLTFSRRSPPSFGQVQIKDLIDRCVLLSQHKLELQHIQLKCSVAVDLPVVNGDFNQLQQCMINLIFNAIDAMPEGGTLVLEGRFDPAERMVKIAVGDTGSGIAEAHLAHIFEPFYTTKEEGYGVGLGLSTVYGIITHHKGTVEVASRVGEGTTFTIRLPAEHETV